MKTGTKEWSDKSLNIQKGCRHGCRYCYAYEMAKRYKRVNDRDDWTKPVPKKKLEKPYKFQGVIMFPTTHDITPKNVDKVSAYIKEWLALGNQFVIVSKPHLGCITKLCADWDDDDYRSQILFRFTIGTMNNKVLKFWEPNAPSYSERKHALRMAYSCGYQTSVSMEPFLDEMVEQTFFDLYPYVTETIWIGKMNKISSRVDANTPDINDLLNRVMNNQTDEKIWKLYCTLKEDPKVMWKDSIKKVVGI